jgi:hypothetical protein
MPAYESIDGLPDPTGPDLDPLDQEENAISADWVRFSEILQPFDDDGLEIGWASREELKCKSCDDWRPVAFFPHPQTSQLCGRCTTIKKKVSANDQARADSEAASRFIASIRSPRLDLDIKMPLLGEESRFRRWDLCESSYVDRCHYLLVHPKNEFALVLFFAPFESQRIDIHEYPVKKFEVTWPVGVGLALTALGFGPVLQRGRLAHAHAYLPNDAFDYCVLGQVAT